MQTNECCHKSQEKKSHHNAAVASVYHFGMRSVGSTQHGLSTLYALIMKVGEAER